MKILPPGVPLSKRLFDVLLTLFVMLFALPLMGILTLLELRYHGRPVLFRQVRPGYRGVAFTIGKFRTMTDARDADGRLLPDGQRITSFGRFLRSTSLDELPELFLVLAGYMSWVGPRPLLMKYLDLYTQEQARRHDVLPGITGWAQVNGRNDLSWEDKFRLDVWYVENWSLWLDVKILWRTFWSVIRREGISQPGYATAEEFKGSADRNPDA